MGVLEGQSLIDQASLESIPLLGIDDENITQGAVNEVEAKV